MMSNSLPDLLVNVIQGKLKEWIGSSVSILNFNSLQGGCINHTGKLSTSSGNFFIKWNNTFSSRGTFSVEAKGLSLLREKGNIHIPEIVGYSEGEDYQFLLLEFIEQKQMQQNYWQLLGEGLAALHRSTNTHYGLDHDNFIGSLHQANNLHLSWIDFFISKRLAPQIELALANELLDTKIVNQFHILYNKLPSLLLEENPALVHGDLWSGNVISNQKGEPCLIDPATYFANREVEIAMTQLFGGFDTKFYESYYANFPLCKGFKERFDVYNLYPLLVHLNLFGNSYLKKITSTVSRFV